MELTLAEIASLTGGQIITGNPEQSFSGLATLKDATPKDISFLGNAKYQSQFQESQAGAILVTAEHPSPAENTALIQVTNPTLAFSTIIDALHKKSNPPFTPGIHPSAYVAESAQLDPQKVQIGAKVVIEENVTIGDGTVIDAGCIVYHSSVIGEHCHLHANVTLREYSQLGHHVAIQPGAVIGSDGYGYQLDQGRHVKIPQVGIVRIDDHVEIGANTTIDRARFGETVIGEGTKIDNLVQIGHNTIIGKHCLIIAQTGIAGSTEIGNYVVIAAQSGITGHLKIGDQAILGARTGVIRNLEGGQTYWGTPARPIVQEQRILSSIAKLPKLLPELKKLKKQIEAQLNEKQ